MGYVAFAIMLVIIVYLLRGVVDDSRRSPEEKAQRYKSSVEQIERERDMLQRKPCNSFRNNHESEDQYKKRINISLKKEAMRRQGLPVELYDFNTNSWRNSRVTYNIAYPDSSDNSTGEIQTGSLYVGDNIGWGGHIVAQYRDGCVYRGDHAGWGATVVGRYENGYIYSGDHTGWGATIVGRYENGYIYRGDHTGWSATIVGRYENGYIYRGDHTGWSATIVGRYMSDDEGSAAAAFLLLLS